MVVVLHRPVLCVRGDETKKIGLKAGDANWSKHTINCHLLILRANRNVQVNLGKAAAQLKTEMNLKPKVKINVKHDTEPSHDTEMESESRFLWELAAAILLSACNKETVFYLVINMTVTQQRTGAGDLKWKWSGIDLSLHTIVLNLLKPNFQPRLCRRRCSHQC